MMTPLRAAPVVLGATVNETGWSPVRGMGVMIVIHVTSGAADH